VLKGYMPKPACLEDDDMQTKTVKLIGMSFSFLLFLSTPILVPNNVSSGMIPDSVTGIRVDNLKTKIKTEYVDSGMSKNSRNSTSETECLAKMIYYEARNQSVKGMYAVADLALNRTESGIYPDSVCGVIKQKHQYPWYSRSKIKSKVPKNSMSQEAWDEAKKVAKISMIHRNTVLPKNVLSFHAKRVKPSWAKRMKLVTVIDQHKFYRPKKA